MKLINDDCLKIFPTIEDKSIDMVLCDLPYGTSACKWDVIIPFDILWKQYSRIIKNEGAIILFAGEPFSSRLRTSNLEMYKYDWKWQKPSGANFLNSHYQPIKIHEDILVFSKSASSFSKKEIMRYNPQMTKGSAYKVSSGKQKTDNSNSSVRSPIKSVETINNGERYPISIIEFNKDKENFHPTQKPVALLEYLIKTYTNENDLVLDNCMGSGSTGVACLNTNRNFIGIEKDEKYFNIAKERIEKHKKSINDLFS